MIDSFYIYSKATEMVKQTGTRNPMKIASEIGVMLRYSEDLMISSMRRIRGRSM